MCTAAPRTGKGRSRGGIGRPLRGGGCHPVGGRTSCASGPTAAPARGEFAQARTQTAQVPRVRISAFVVRKERRSAAYSCGAGVFQTSYFSGGRPSTSTVDGPVASINDGPSIACCTVGSVIRAQCGQYAAVMQRQQQQQQQQPQQQKGIAYGGPAAGGLQRRWRPDGQMRRFALLPLARRSPAALAGSSLRSRRSPVLPRDQYMSTRGRVALAMCT